MIRYVDAIFCPGKTPLTKATLLAGIYFLLQIAVVFILQALGVDYDENEVTERKSIFLAGVIIAPLIELVL